MIRAEQRGRVTVLTLEHGKANAFDVELCRGVVSVLDEMVREGAESVVLTGRGKIFSAGVDLFRLLDGGRDYVEEFLPALDAALQAVVTFPAPLVAAVNGHAIAGGCVVACGCDRRLASPGGGRIGVPELAVGVPFPTLAFELVRVGAPRAVRDLVFSARTVEMEEARELGVIDRLVEGEVLLEAACEEAERLARLPREGFALTKRQFWEPAMARKRTVGAGWDEEVLEQWCGEEARGRVREYLEKTVGRG